MHAGRTSPFTYLIGIEPKTFHSLWRRKGRPILTVASRSIYRSVFFLALAVFQLMQIQHHVAALVHVAVQPVQRNADDVAVLDAAAGRNVAYLRPYLVDQVHVVLGQARRVGAQVESVFSTIAACDP